MTRPELRRTADGDQRATSLELFYDLVFVFAVTQVSHHLLDDLTWRGAGQ
jgi:low temperature requirement protein LtrA